MEQITLYLLKANTAIAILFMLYWLLVRNKHNFQLNRLYLLSILLFSFIFPFLSFPVEIEEMANINQMEFSDIAYDFADFSNLETIVAEPSEQTIDFQQFFSYAYLLVALLLLLRFIIEIIHIIKKIFAYEKIKNGRFTLVVNKAFKSPFSFLHFIFVEKYPAMDSLVMEHEKVHARQFHTIDLFIAQISSALLWINPFMYLLKKEIVAQHEYLADYGVLNNGNNHEKYLNQVFIQAQNHFNSQLVSKFNYSLTKKRLKMMKNIDSKQKSIFKYLILFIATGLIAGLFAFTNTNNLDMSRGRPSVIPVLMKTIDNKPSIWPIKKGEAKISSKFGMQIHPIYKKKKMHIGIDFKAERGTEIYATADGKVREASYKDAYGHRIIIDHDKVYSTLYAHLSKYKVKSGDQVKKGDVIGYVGSTGLSTAPHLHYEVWKNGVYVNPDNYLD